MYTLIVSYMFCSVMSQSGLLGIINNNYADHVDSICDKQHIRSHIDTNVSYQFYSFIIATNVLCVCMFQHAHLFTVCYMNSSVFTWYILHIQRVLPSSYDYVNQGYRQSANACLHFENTVLKSSLMLEVLDLLNPFWDPLNLNSGESGNFHQSL